MNQINRIGKFQFDARSNLFSFFNFCKALILFCIISLSFSFTNEIKASPFAKIDTLIHACGGEGGVIEFEILGTPISNYTWYWQHGPTDLRLEDLSPGTYVFYLS